MTRGTVQVFAVALAILSAGCMHGEFLSPRLDLGLQNASLGGAACDEHRWRFAAEEECHQFGLSVVNNNQDQEADLGVLFWSAQVAAGGVYDAVAVVGPDRVVAGGSAEVVVLVAAPAGNTFGELRYGLRWADASSAVEIPAYR